MAKPFQVWVFGKKGCDKCAVLNQRLDKLLADERWSAFEKTYWDVETQEGIVAFCEAECVNPQRIPAFLVARLNETSGVYEPVPAPCPGNSEPPNGHARLYSCLGMQTDYSRAGGGVITPKMIAAILQEAVSANFPDIHHGRDVHATKQWAKTFSG